MGTPALTTELALSPAMLLDLASISRCCQRRQCPVEGLLEDLADVTEGSDCALISQKRGFAVSILE
eukprot:3836052-Rhodomonas_salina.1